jgi:hypothetical protein
LRAERVGCIFLIRGPEETIRSILDLTRTFYTPWTSQRAVDYYCRRLEELAEYSASPGIRSEALTYNDLLFNTSTTLRRLESFLGLDRQLRENYRIQKFTGKRGDPSGNIFRGHIVRHQDSKPVEIPARELERARHAYETCARALELK